MSCQLPASASVHYATASYSYHHSKHLIVEARRRAGLTSPQRKKGSVDRLTREDLEAIPILQSLADELRRKGLQQSVPLQHTVLH